MSIGHVCIDQLNLGNSGPISKQLLFRLHQKVDVDKFKARVDEAGSIYFTQEEDFLKYLHEVQMVGSWKLISEKMNQKFSSFQRSAKQCRERYINYVEIGPLKNEQAWNQQNDELLFLKYKELGSKWTEIRKFIPGRSENFLKNKFYGAMRRVHRRITKTEKQNKLIKQKAIKFDSILKVLQNSEPTGPEIRNEDTGNTLEWIQQLKQSLIQMALSQKDKSNQEMLELIKRIHKFNSEVRFFNIIKQRKGKSVKRKNLPPLSKKMQQAKIQVNCIYGLFSNFIQLMIMLPSPTHYKKPQIEPKEQEIEIKKKVFNGQEILMLSTNRMGKEEKMCKYEISEDMQQLLEKIEFSFQKAKHKDLLQEVNIILECSYSKQNVND